MQMKDINSSVIQNITTRWHTGSDLKRVNAKTIKNRVGSLRSAWKYAMEWNFTRTAFPIHLRLPYWDKDEAKAGRPAYDMKVAKELVAQSEFPYNLIWWLTYELHVRRGEVCGLDVGHINLTTRQVTVRRNRVMSTVKCTKARKPRVFTISEELCEALRPLTDGRSSSEPLFLSPKGKRLGHSEESTTMLYTHAVGEDDANVAAVFGKQLSEAFTQSFTHCGVDSDLDELMLIGTA
jgi:integrase